MLEGYLKLDTLRRSGCKRAFLAWALKENPNPTRVARTPKIDNESGQQYNARVQQAGFSKGTALKFRIVTWTYRGRRPRRPQTQDLLKCLEGAGIEETKILRATTSTSPWTVLGKVHAEFETAQVLKTSVLTKKPVATEPWSTNLEATDGQTCRTANLPTRTRQRSVRSPSGLGLTTAPTRSSAAADKVTVDGTP